MPTTLTATEAKKRFLTLIDDVEAGQTFEITKRGRLVARLGPVPETRSSRSLMGLKDSLKGIAVTASTDEELYSTGQFSDGEY